MLSVLAEVRKYSAHLPLLGTFLVKRIHNIAWLPHVKMKIITRDDVTRTRKGLVATAYTDFKINRLLITI